MSVSSRKVSAWLLVILLPAAGFAIWNGYHQFLEKRAAAEAAADGEVPTPKWHFVSEEHWLVDETARDITEMLAFAAKGNIDGLQLDVTPEPGVSEAFALRASVGGTKVSSDLRWKDYIWSPAEYAPWAENLLTALRLAPSNPPTADNTLIQNLTTPTPETIHREAERISAALTKAPLDAGLHEQAALVTAAFALREMAGTYCDSRREICRIAAHLAIARALQPQGTGTAGKVADAALQTLVERETSALQLLDQLDQDKTPGVAAWARALRLRNTGDWRSVSSEPTLLEQLEVFIARTRSVNAQFAWQWLEARKAAPLHDWRRILLQGGLTIDLGHQFAEQSIPQEINSLQADWMTHFGKRLANSDIVKAFNEPPARSIGKQADGHANILVLGWDMWSAQHQRHLLAAIKSTISFLRDHWGVPEYREVQMFARKNFAALRLFPIIEPELTENRGDDGEISKHVTQLLTEHPEAISPAVWGLLAKAHDKGPALAIADPQSWVKPALPFGTTYDICLRVGRIELPGKKDPAWWDAAMQRAPASYDLRYAKLWTLYGTAAPMEMVETTYAPMADYSLWALWAIMSAEKDKSPKYLETLKKICALDPDRNFNLGDCYVKAGQIEQAVAAYEKGVDVCTDRVLVANSCDWLVNYLDDHEQKQKALAIATEAAEVYSAAGLETMARLQEKHGQLHDAENYFSKIAERYEDPSALNAFYRRNAGKDPQFKAAAQKLERQAFPNGMQKVSLEDFKAPPVDGTALTNTSSLSRTAGVQKGDVIVAIDGYQVHNEQQYLFARDLSSDPHFTLIVWKGHEYRQISANAPNRRFNVDLKDYHSR